ncbi:hypothetical protein CRG98_021908 [Punica granatum]|uniref:Phospholipase A1 n=1 Tax=Punica granatum TaxID=22663 RepID=A0A2I0JQD8_PUNGR|nr:hypothetical protein CRG98_021908 [Punica granatum]
MIRNISKRWRELSGQNDWASLLQPLDLDLRRYIIHYGELAQATYDTFNSQRASKYEGNSRYREKDLFSKAWDKESNWMGFVAVATDGGRDVLGRRDIVISWRGTIQVSEWESDFNFPLVPATKILGDLGDPMVHAGWLSIYTSADPESVYNKMSARQQVLDEVQRLLEEFKDEEISITITGHSLGAALGTLNAVDIVTNGLNKNKAQPGAQPCPVTAFLFASPHVGDTGFRTVFQSQENLHLLRVRNVPDVIPTYPMVRYTDVGEELQLDNRRSPYLKSPGNVETWHNLEGYLHGVAGTHGAKGKFCLEVKRDISLVNKSSDMLKDKFMVPNSWWCMRNKGMVQQKDRSWKLDDHDV